MFILTCKHLYELNMRTEIFSQILYLLQTLWFKAINFSFIHSICKFLTGLPSQLSQAFCLLLTPHGQEVTNTCNLDTIVSAQNLS